MFVNFMLKCRFEMTTGLKTKIDESPVFNPPIHNVKSICCRFR